MIHEKSSPQKSIVLNIKSNKDKIHKLSINDLKLQTKTQLKLRNFSNNFSHASPFQKSLSLKNWNKGNKILPVLNVMLSHRERSEDKSQFRILQLVKSQSLFKIKTPMIKEDPEQVLFYYQNLNQNVVLKNSYLDIQNKRQIKNSFKPKQVLSKTVYKWKQLQKRNIKVNRKQQMFQRKIQQNPNELITRKLEWDGKQTKKIDRNQIHLQLLKQITEKKTNKNIQTKSSWFKKKQIIDLKNLNGWQQQEIKWQIA